MEVLTINILMKSKTRKLAKQEIYCYYLGEKNRKGPLERQGPRQTERAGTEKITGKSIMEQRVIQ